MHSDWDLVHMDLPARVFTPEHMAAKGQHYIVHYSSRSHTDYTYTDAIDVHVLPTPVHPPEKIYGEFTQSWGWSKTDHCQFIEPKDVITAVHDATHNITQCREDFTTQNIASIALPLGINVVPVANPDVVPRTVTRAVERVNPICLVACASGAGFCRLAGTRGPACTAPAVKHVVTWANPALSGVYYTDDTIRGARPGHYLGFAWDDAVHDVWLVPEGVAGEQVCNVTGNGATQVMPPSHHATFDPTTNQVVPGRELYAIPASAAGTTLTFVCNINGHCGSGQRVDIDVAEEAATPDTSLALGVCPADYALCPDQSLQTEVTAEIITTVNVPWLNPLAAEGIRLAGNVTRASTPWANWTHRRLEGRKCRARAQNTANAGVDKYNKDVWSFEHRTLREVVEACSSNHPDKCVGISWRGTLNYSITNPAVREYDQAHRTSSTLDNSPGWVASGGAGRWMQMDLGGTFDVTGVVTQARGNRCCGDQYVTGFQVLYKVDAADAFSEIPGVLQGPTAETYAASWHTKINAFFPSVVRARYIRIVVVTKVGAIAMRAGVLLHVGNDVMAGRHEFRRCLATDGYDRVVAVPPLTNDQVAAAADNYTLPSDFTRSVACPGCRSCREVPLAPHSAGASKSFWGVYGPERMALGFRVALDQPGTGGAVLTVRPEIPYSRTLTWTHSPEFICRVEPGAVAGPLEPDLEVDPEWITFLVPADMGDTPAARSLANGIQPAEAFAAWADRGQRNLAAVYPPGESVDPGLAPQDTYRSPDWFNMSIASAGFVPPAQQLGGSEGGAWWPPRPALKVTFMPTTPECTNGNHGKCTTYWWDVIDRLKGEASAMGWHVDHGGNGSVDTTATEHTNAATGETAVYGWRCSPEIDWYGGGWSEAAPWAQNIPAFAHGIVRYPGWYNVGGSHFAACPDGRPNAFEAVVPNGVYMVTVGSSRNHGQSCLFENVLPPQLGHVRSTSVFSVEVADGSFTISQPAAGGGTCNHVNWFKLDLVSETLLPQAWLPAPRHEWWQQTVPEHTAIGLVQIRMPHDEYRTTASYPSAVQAKAQDCRKWWLYGPAKCHRSLVTGYKEGVHPDLGLYPNFPGFSEPFLDWLFDQHDSDGNGVLVYEEFRAAELVLVRNGSAPYTLWETVSPAYVNWKGTRGYHDDNAAHLWMRIDVIDADWTDGAGVPGRGDGMVTRDEFVHGPLSLPRGTFCDMFESTAKTHGGNHGVGHCGKDANGLYPVMRGEVPDDGAHGFVVAVSDTPCTDEAGCPSASDASTNTTLCEYRLNRLNEAVASVDCGGATGKFVHVSLPGAFTRLLPVEDAGTDGGDIVTVHMRSTVLGNSTPAGTDPGLPLVCYGIVPRPVPAPDDPDLLAGTKLHPKIIVDDNPEDPIFWSTCYDRVIVKEWLPLLGADDDDDEAAPEYAFLNGTRCLACDSIRQNLPNATDVLAGPEYFLLPAEVNGHHCPAGTGGIGAAAECVAAALAAAAATGQGLNSSWQPDAGHLLVGSWQHTPSGCFVEGGTDTLRPHFNLATSGGYFNDGGFHKVCYRPAPGTEFWATCAAHAQPCACAGKIRFGQVFDGVHTWSDPVVRNASVTCGTGALGIADPFDRPNDNLHDARIQRRCECSEGPEVMQSAHWWLQPAGTCDGCGYGPPIGPEPTGRPTTLAPTTLRPTTAVPTVGPSAAPSTTTPTAVGETFSPTAAPTTPLPSAAPSSSPLSGAPTGAPTPGPTAGPTPGPTAGLDASASAGDDGAGDVALAVSLTVVALLAAALVVIAVLRRKTPPAGTVPSIAGSQARSPPVMANPAYVTPPAFLPGAAAAPQSDRRHTVLPGAGTIVSIGADGLPLSISAQRRSSQPSSWPQRRGSINVPGHGEFNL